MTYNFGTRQEENTSFKKQERVLSVFRNSYFGSPIRNGLSTWPSIYFTEYSFFSWKRGWWQYCRSLELHNSLLGKFSKKYSCWDLRSLSFVNTWTYSIQCCHVNDHRLLSFTEEVKNDFDRKVLRLFVKQCQQQKLRPEKLVVWKQLEYAVMK